MQIDPYPALLAQRLKGWQPDLIGTLIFVRRGNRILLIHKRRGHGAGKINGPGGKLEPGETPLACALRELQEEVGVQADRATLCARIKFVELAGFQWFGYVYLADHSTGEPISTEEAIPQWFTQDSLPWSRMWPDDLLWLPRVLNGERLEAEFLFRDGELLASNVRNNPAIDDRAPTRFSKA